MNLAASQLALREWRGHLLHPLTVTALTGVIAVLALIGPFGTLTSLSFPERAAYWGLIVVAGYTIGYLVSYAVLRKPARSMRRVVRVLLAGVVTGVFVGILVSLANLLVFGFLTRLSDLPEFLGTITGVSVVVMAVLDVFTRQLNLAARAPEAKKDAAPLLDRLPYEKRGALVAVSVEDHYVRIQTVKGEHMLLMRLADAIREVGTTPGTQVHRSHWAAFDQIVKVTKHADRATLRMSNGSDVPVSRSNLPKLKDAGLLV